MLVTRDVPKDPAESSLIAKYKELVRPIASKVIGHITDGRHQDPERRRGVASSAT